MCIRDSLNARLKERKRQAQWAELGIYRKGDEPTGLRLFEKNYFKRNPVSKLRAGERQGDIFANVEEPFAMEGKKGTDHETRQREKEAKAKATRDFAARNQLDFTTNPRRNGK